MKMLAASALLCAVVALSAADGQEDTQDEKAQDLDKRSLCPGGWYPINGRCFYYFRRPMTWARAQRTCQYMGANLASVHGWREHRRIQRLIRAVSSRYAEAWIGGSDAQEEGIWLWSDGTRVNYQYWCRGEPNNHGRGQNCLQMNHAGGRCWDDLSCLAVRPFVCAKHM